MIVRFGFVAMSLFLEDASPSKTMTYKSYQTLTSDESRLHRLKKISKENLTNTLRILIHAHTHGIKLYRLTSKLIPLATHIEVINWNYCDDLKEYFLKIGDYVNSTGIRISAHPDHFTLLSNNNPEITQSSIRDLEYHNNLFNAMSLSYDPKLVLHIGGAYKNKSKAIDNFMTNYNSLSPDLKNRIILENDDKTYTATEVHCICKILNIPMVFDVHHNMCNSDGSPLLKCLEEAFNTWNDDIFPPKVHYSSPKSMGSIRSHADEIDADALYEFLLQAKAIDRDFDIMLEAKNKDKALFDLMTILRNKYDVDGPSDAIIEI